jgi:hypothetical protein
LPVTASEKQEGRFSLHRPLSNPGLKTKCLPNHQASK